MSDLLLEQIRSFSALEWISTIASLIYVVLAMKNKVSCFFFAIIASLCWAYVSFYTYRLGFDALLQLFYAIMGGVGIYTWSMKKNGKQLPISTLSFNYHVVMIAGTSVLSIAAAYLFSLYLTNFNMPYVDALTTGFSILATFLLIYRKISSWLYLLVCDLIYGLYIYPSQEAYLFMLLMIVYSITAILGYIEWSKQKSYLDVV